LVWLDFSRCGNNDSVEIPEGKRTGKTPKYTLEEVEKITEAVGGVAPSVGFGP